MYDNTSNSLVNKFYEYLISEDLTKSFIILDQIKKLKYPNSILNTLQEIYSIAQAGHLKNFDKVQGPLVSVIIPIYDRTDILKIAIESILNQSYINIELLLISDGSPKETLDIIHSYSRNPRIRVFYFPYPSGNAVRARNKGILEAKGKYIAFLDSDDIAAKHRVALSVETLETDHVDVVYGDWEALLDGSRLISNIQNGDIIKSAEFDFDLMRKCCIPCQSTVTVRRSIFNKAGYIKPKLEYREDHELWVRLAYFGALFKRIPDILVSLRLHSGNNELNFSKTDHIWETLVQQEFALKGPLPKKIVFILPSVGISGGIGVVFKHTNMLLTAGHDVTIINMGHRGDGSWFPNLKTPIIHVDDCSVSNMSSIDMLFATEWSTVAHLSRWDSLRKLYFVQSDERRFHDDPAKKTIVHNTYNQALEFVTEAHWIRKMLKDEFSQKSFYVPNGLDPTIFYKSDPIVPKNPKKLRVLLEGPICIPFKGMADSYAAVADLDCELWIISSAGRPPDSWRYDRFFEAVPFTKMCSIYSSCDIFLKMSRVEGFFGPPLEAMACGCAVVVGKVTGYDEFIVNESNALVVDQGDVQGARSAVQRLLTDDDLRLNFLHKGYITSQQWTWDNSAKFMLEVVNTNVEKDIL